MWCAIRSDKELTDVEFWNEWEGLNKMECNHKEYTPDCPCCEERAELSAVKKAESALERAKIQWLIAKYEPVLKEIGFTEVCRQLVKQGDVK